jgi:hypothetical protein
MENRRGALILIGLLSIAIIGAGGWYLISPLFIDRSVDEELPLVFPEPTSTAGGSLAPTTLSVTSTAPMSDEQISDEMDQAISLATGTFKDADRFHQGEGVATLYKLPDGNRILRFEVFEVTNGPDLHVYLATGAAPTGSEDLGEYVDLGELKGNIGNQNYEIPDELSLDGYNSVVIYCVPFHIVFSYAPLDG